MWEWYRIGFSLGLGVALGGALSALIAPRRALLPVAVVGAAAGAAALGYFAIDGWHEAVSGGVGGALGALAADATMTGALGRGGTRGATSLIRVLAALGL